MNKNKETFWNIRNVITLIITGGVIISTIGIAIWACCPKTENKDAMDILTKTLIPLWGTWMGAILAFHFSKENFQAAENAMRETLERLTPDEKLKTIPVSKLMIPLNKLIYYTLNDVKNKTIKEILEDKRFLPYSRYAVLDEKKCLLYIIHRRDFTQYITDKLNEDSSSNPLMIKFEDYQQDLKNEKNKDFDWKSDKKFVSIDDNLLIAKEKISDSRRGRDVFVTEKGKENEPVIGLITDDDILKEMKG